MSQEKRARSDSTHRLDTEDWPTRVDSAPGLADAVRKAAGPPPRPSPGAPDEHWRELASDAAVPEARRIDLAYALALADLRVPLERINLQLLVPRTADAGGLIDRAAASGEFEPTTLAEASVVSSSWRSAPVQECARRGIKVFESRNRMALCPPDAPGRIGAYRIVCRLGKGGMGEVFLAFRPGLEKDLALKRMRLLAHCDEALRSRFALEARVLARLSHPNLVSLIDVDVASAEPFLVMDYVPGVDLGRRIKKGLSFELAARILARVARCLDYAHRQGVLHRDIKPPNILLDFEDEPYLMDFGLARLSDSLVRMTGRGELMGTPGYMPPEWISDERVYTEKSDVYALGAVLYECLTGRPPFQGETLSGIFRDVTLGNIANPRTLRPDVPLELERICLDALAADPARRTASARDVANSLEAWGGGRGSRTAGGGSIGRRQRASRRVLAALLAAVVLAVAGVFVVAPLLGERPTSRDEKDPAPIAISRPGWRRVRMEGGPPPGRWGQGVEISGTRFAVAGGAVDPRRDENWEWDSTLWWLERLEADEPAFAWRSSRLPGSGRAGCGVVWLEEDQEFLIFGGKTETRAFPHMWRFRPPDDWRSLESAFPAVYYGSLFAFLDAAGNRVVALHQANPSKDGAPLTILGYPLSGEPRETWEPIEDAPKTRAVPGTAFQATFDPVLRRIYAGLPEREGDRYNQIFYWDIPLETWSSPIELEPDLARLLHHGFVASGGYLAIPLAPALDAPFSVYVARIAGPRPRFHPLPGLGLCYGQIASEDAGSLLFLCGTTRRCHDSWDQAWAIPWDEVKAWVDQEDR